ncbi:MAG: DUF2924 domain-containing protein, partial [Rhizobiales bacterium]|nr:DUF2924 domain-containing protein [Hyphomicrobiales bacterium]
NVAAAAREGRRSASPRPTLLPGARLLREWHGKTHVVTVVEEGFDYAGKRYRSLTEIAREITGTHWSGPRFFGLGAAGGKARAKSGRGKRAAPSVSAPIASVAAKLKAADHG